MSFLNPWAALAIASAVIPALVLLYFLKLRRREVRVPSTLLWKRAVQDLQVNAPFQRLRKNLLLLLQLLVLGAGLFALARPVVRSSVSSESRVILLIDRSASMNAVEGARTRLDEAKEQAVRIVRTLNRGGSGFFTGWLSSLFRLTGNQPDSQVMVLAFADRATIVSPFTTDTSAVESLIRAIEPTDGPSRLREALELAETYMTSPVESGVGDTPISTQTPAKLVLLSDGRITDESELVLRSGTLELIPIGQARDNLGITALRIARNYEKPELLSAFLQVRNFGPQPVNADVALRVDGVLQTVKNVSLAASTAPEPPGSQPSEPAGPAATALRFEISQPRAAVLTAEISRGDALAADNVAHAVVPPPRRLRVLLVSDENFFLDSALSGLPLEKLDRMSPREYESAAADRCEKDGASLYDVVIFDKHSTRRLPRGNYLFFGGAPQLPGVTLGEEIDNQPLIWWDESHPLLRYVSFDNVYVSGWRRLSVPPEAQRLIEGPDSPVLVHLWNEGRQVLVMAFPVEMTNWVLRNSFVAFMYNAVRFLASDAAGETGASSRVGEVLRIPVPPGTRSTTVKTPDGRGVTVAADASGVARFGDTTRVGLYQAQPAAEGRERYAVNLEDAGESDIAPRTDLRVGTQRVAVGKPVETGMPEVWRWFVAAALLIALLEWYIYNRRVFV